MQVIQHIELSSSASSITFSDIPQTFTDLYLVVSARGSASSDTIPLWRVNNSDSGYTARTLRGNGSSVSSGSFTTLTHESKTWGRLEVGGIQDSGTTANTFASLSLYIPNYTSTAAKSISVDYAGENNATAAIQGIAAGLWSGTDAISTLAFALYNTTMVQYSSATLFGITAGSDGVTSVS